MFAYLQTVNHSMSITSKPLKVILYLLLLSCLLVLSKYILFKKSLSSYKNYFAREYSSNTYKQGLNHANTTPFKTIKLMQSSSLDDTYKMQNLAGNVAGFIPLGILLPILFWRKGKGLKTVFFIFLISFAFETIQLITGLGVFDVDDLILNTAGGIIGYLFFLLGKIIFR